MHDRRRRCVLLVLIGKRQMQSERMRKIQWGGKSVADGSDEIENQHTFKLFPSYKS